MKKKLCHCFSILLLIGCSTPSGKRVNYEIDEGDMKLTITKDYIILDSCAGLNGFGEDVWEFNKTISRSDTTACRELLERLLKR